MVDARGGGADQCLDGNQYHKNSERVAGCWGGGGRGDGDGEGGMGVGGLLDVGLVACCKTAAVLARSCPSSARAGRSRVIPPRALPGL